MEQVLTFEKLPEAVTMLTKEVSELKRLIIEKQEQPTTEADQLLTIEQAAEILHLTVPTLYGKVHRGELPYMKRSKRLYFSKAELIDYLKQGRKKTHAEAAAEAETYIKKKGVRNG